MTLKEWAYPPRLSAFPAKHKSEAREYHEIRVFLQNLLKRGVSAKWPLDPIGSFLRRFH